jgi:hypothetical protein
VYAAALLLRAAKRAAFADELHHTAEILFSVRKRLRESS